MESIMKHNVLTEPQVRLRQKTLQICALAIAGFAFCWLGGFIVSSSDFGYFEILRLPVGVILAVFSLVGFFDHEKVLGTESLSHREVKEMESMFDKCPAAAEVVINAVKAGVTLRKRDKQWFDDAVNKQINDDELSKALATIAGRSSK